MEDQSVAWGNVDVLNLVNQATQFIKLPILYNQAYQEVNECDKQTNDILHYYELIEDLTDEDILEKAHQLIEIRIKRRKAKDFVKINEDLVAFIEDNRRFFNTMDNIKGRIRTIKDRAEKRVYVPRVETSMESAFKQMEGKR